MKTARKTTRKTTLDIDERFNSIRLSLDTLFGAVAKLQVPATTGTQTLVWTQGAPMKLQWVINVNPTTLTLTPGTTLRVLDNGGITTYDGIGIGFLNEVDARMLRVCKSDGAKLHVYFTTNHDIGVKYGRVKYAAQC